MDETLVSAGDEKIKKIYTHRQTHAFTYTHMEYYSTIKKNEIMPFAATWMDSEITISIEVSQIEKDIYYMLSLIREI